MSQSRVPHSQRSRSRTRSRYWETPFFSFDALVYLQRVTKNLTGGIGSIGWSKEPNTLGAFADFNLWNSPFASAEEIEALLPRGMVSTSTAGELMDKGGPDGPPIAGNELPEYKPG